jgi:hypothetical protein
VCVTHADEDMGKCKRCHKSKTDVKLRSCEDRLCESCSEYNDMCLRDSVMPDWEAISRGESPSGYNGHDPDVVSNAHALKDNASQFKCSLVVNPVLAYMSCNMNSSTADDITRSCQDFYSVQELILAKDILWAVGSVQHLPPKRRRREGKYRTESEAITSDIVEALSLLDAADKMPRFGVDAALLKRIPGPVPTENNTMSLCTRLLDLECRMNRAEENLSSNVCKTLELEEKVTKTTSYAAKAATSLSKKTLELEDKLSGTATTSGWPSLRSNTNQPAARPHQPSVPSVDQRDVPVPGTARTHDVKMSHAASTTSLTSAASSQPSGNQEEFQYPRYHRRRKTTIRGTRAGSNIRIKGAPEPSRDVFVYRVDKGTTDIEDFLTDNGINSRSVIIVSNNEARFSSFKVEVKVSELEKLLDPEFWPDGICVRRFYKPRSKPV